MKIGTRSILYGAHQFILHPIMLSIAWTKLYGFPWDPRLWVAFAVHDLGYWGKPNMDGEEGERHPELGGKIINLLFGGQWANFTIFHSRYYAEKYGETVSQLWAADKLATIITPKCIYLWLVKATGEVNEYMDKKVVLKYPCEYRDTVTGQNINGWHNGLVAYMGRMVNEGKDSAIPVGRCQTVFLLDKRKNHAN